jgi:hypothetical protein
LLLFHRLNVKPLELSICQIDKSSVFLYTLTVINPKKSNIDAGVYRLANGEKIRNKIQNDSPEIQYCWRNHRQLGCIRFYDTSVVLNLRALVRSTRRKICRN